MSTVFFVSMLPSKLSCSLCSNNYHSKPISDVVNNFLIVKKSYPAMCLVIHIFPLLWCPMRDSNPHDCSLVPKTSASTNSANWAFICGAGERIRTLDLLITSELLYQLSYTGVNLLIYVCFTVNSFWTFCFILLNHQFL